MRLTQLDWLFVCAYFLFNLAVGLYYRRRAGRSVEEFFVSGRSAAWWLAGTSMVATTFSADTPLAVTGMVARGGIAGNWLWWNFAFSGMLTVFFFSRLWRRAGVITDAEFAEIRYAGKPAAFLRAYRGLYLAIPINCIVIGWVNLAMVKVLMLALGIDKFEAILVVLALTALTSAVSTLSGLRGVLVTDLVQFVLMIGMALALAFFAVQGIGGIDGLKVQLAAIEGGGSPLSFLPEAGSAWMPMLTFFVYIAVIWWGTWYPGAEPGGGGFIAQRVFSTRDERHSVLATLWFNVAHYAVRPWPWIIVALVSLTAYPDLDDPESGYIHAMMDYMPPALRGLMLASFVAAFMSTISTILNTSASYVINDFYHRFVRKEASQRHLVIAARVATIILTVIAAVITFYMDSIAGAWKLLLATGAGTGGVLIVRWLWWRVNAWSEVAAMTSAFAISTFLQVGVGLDTDEPRDFAWVMLISVFATTVIWITVTLLTAPEPAGKLKEFYRRVRPHPTLWGPIAKEVPDVSHSGGVGQDLLNWGLSCGMVYGALFAVGKLLLREWTAGFFSLGVAAVGAICIARSVAKPAPYPEVGS